VERPVQRWKIVFVDLPQSLLRDAGPHDRLALFNGVVERVLSSVDLHRTG
jgi:hypothetical protein